MSEIDARAAYEDVLAELERQVPWLYEQVVAEIGRGTELKASEISHGEMASRNRELASQDLGRLSDADLAVVELTYEQRLMVVVRAVSVATDAYNASVETLTKFAREHGAQRYEFASPSDEAVNAEEAPDADVGAEDLRTAFVIPDDAETVSREAIDNVLEALDTDE